MSSQTGKPVTGWRDWLARIALAVVVPALLLGLAEGALRVAAIGHPAAATSPCTVGGAPATCENLFFTATFFPRGMVRTPRPYAIPARKAPGTFRIFVLGESAAYGDPDPAYAFSRYLEVALQQRFPDMRFEVFNTGITAINSHLILPIAKELAQRQPDMFIVYAGNNEVVGPYGPGTVLTSSAMSMPAIRASILVRSSRLGQLIASLVANMQGSGKQQPQEWHGMEMFLEKQVPASSPLMRHVYSNLETNLRDITVVARRSGARVVVSTIGTNLRDCAPFASVHRDGLTQEALRAWSGLMEQAAVRESGGDYSGALKLYQSAAEIDAEPAELQFRMARCLWNLGDFSGAREHFVRAQDLDSLRFRADSRMNEIIRGVALTAGPGVELVDGAEVFAEASPHGIAGSELFYDHVHMTPLGNYLLARALFPQVIAALADDVRRSAASTDFPSEEECEKMLALTAYDRSRLAGDMLWRMQRPPFTGQLNHEEQMARLRAEAQGPWESFEETASQYRWAIARNPADRMLHLRYALLLYPRDRAAALQEFHQARPYDGFPVLTPDGMLAN